MAYKPKECADCGVSFTPASGSQQKCSDCGTSRTPIIRRCSSCAETFKPSRNTSDRCLSCIAGSRAASIQCPMRRCLVHYVPGEKHECDKPSESVQTSRLERVNAEPDPVILAGPQVSDRAMGVSNRPTKPRPAPESLSEAVADDERRMTYEQDSSYA